MSVVDTQGRCIFSHRQLQRNEPSDLGTEFEQAESRTLDDELHPPACSRQEQPIRLDW